MTKIMKRNFNISTKILDVFDAIELNDYTLFTNLLTVDYEVNKMNKFGQTLLMKSIEKGNLAMIRCLINNNADLHQMDNSLNMAIDYATWSEDEEVLGILRCRIRHEEMEFARLKRA
jgi:ankyrin repeat protein